MIKSKIFDLKCTEVVDGDEIHCQHCHVYSKWAKCHDDLNWLGARGMWRAGGVLSNFVVVIFKGTLYVLTLLIVDQSTLHIYNI